MASKYKRLEKKIRKYRSKLSNIKFRQKLSNLVYRVGIYSDKEFQLEDLPDKQKLVFPCHLGILFCEQDLNRELFDAISDKLNKIFGTFFYNIQNLGSYNFSKAMLRKGTKTEKSAHTQSERKFNLHPTNKFYQLLIDKRIENDLDMIAAITSLPLYSSNHNDINFLFGEAHLMHDCCVISTLKLKEGFYNREENDHILEQRITKEIIHEVGHLILGDEHCEENSCVMKFSEKVDEIDNKSIHLCLKCMERLKGVKKEYNI